MFGWAHAVARVVAHGKCALSKRRGVGGGFCMGYAWAGEPPNTVLLLNLIR